MHNRRKCGVLLHPTSLPGVDGIGSLGMEAKKFIDFLDNAGQSIWQVLPLGPVAYGNSPYSCYSSFAGNPLLIDLLSIAEEGDLSDSDLQKWDSKNRVKFDEVENYKMQLLRKAAANFFNDGAQNRKQEFWYFCDEASWLGDFAFFMALKEFFHGKSWCDWPEGIARRSPQAMLQYAEELATVIREYKYIQWQFFRQWDATKKYANSKGVEIIGDIPIFVAFDSTDVWANPHLFQLDDNNRPAVVAGVPPDYFSETGQLWGNPLYNWENIADQGFSWWIDRIKINLLMYDVVRIDHFRGFAANWEIPAKEKTAINGRWVKGPGEALFNALHDALGALPIIAEDLGIITQDVEALRSKFKFPGMKVLQFAFGSGSDNPYLPHNFARSYVVYTGTHDNDTTRGWFSRLENHEKQQVLAYLRCPGEEVVWEMIRAAVSSVAEYAVIPLQDLLEFDSAERMNIPGVAVGNWGWRLAPDLLNNELAVRLREITAMYNRLK